MRSFFSDDIYLSGYRAGPSSEWLRNMLKTIEPIVEPGPNMHTCIPLARRDIIIAYDGSPKDGYTSWQGRTTQMRLAFLPSGRLVWVPRFYISTKFGKEAHFGPMLEARDATWEQADAVQQLAPGWLLTAANYTPLYAAEYLGREFNNIMGVKTTFTNPWANPANGGQTSEHPAKSWSDIDPTLWPAVSMAYLRVFDSPLPVPPHKATSGYVGLGMPNLVEPESRRAFEWLRLAKVEA